MAMTLEIAISVPWFCSFGLNTLVLSPCDTPFDVLRLICPHAPSV